MIREFIVGGITIKVYPPTGKGDKYHAIYLTTEQLNALIEQGVFDEVLEVNIK